MSKKSKLKKPKCPQCKSNKEVEEEHHDCPSCNCGEIYYCQKCGCEFNKNGEKF